ncbi:MAG: hypothetical protein V3U64_01680 [Cocleimonas sp.]
MRNGTQSSTIGKMIFSIAIIISSTQVATAKPNINDMQGCQGIIDFVDGKLNPAPAKYNAADVKKIRHGLKIYNDFIQRTIVTPGLLQFNKGNAAKANAMQKQVNAYKAQVVRSYKKRYPQPRLFGDFAISLNNCAKQAVPKGANLSALKTALQTIIKLGKQG